MMIAQSITTTRAEMVIPAIAPVYNSSWLSLGGAGAVVDGVVVVWGHGVGSGGRKLDNN